MRAVGQWPPLRGALQPVQQFVATEAAGGLVLLLAAVAAIAWANSPWSDAYQRLVDMHIVLDIGVYALDESLHFWINDVAMVVFFFLIGLEIKREFVIGELNSVRRAMAPLAAAAGGMIFPAAIFLVLVRDAEASKGWGVPVATDIAFALGVASLLGSRVPIGLKVLLLGIAIFDDLGAVAVIAVFYAAEVSVTPLLVGLGLLGVAYGLRELRLRYVPVFVLVGVATWVAVFESGVHPTTVGVAFGLLTPSKPPRPAEEFIGEAREILHALEADSPNLYVSAGRHQHTEAMARLRELNARSVAPLDRLEHALNPWVAFGIVPAFAFANAGVDLRGEALSMAAAEWLTWGVAFGLFVGKPVGIVLGMVLAVRLGAELPAGVTWAGVAGIGALAGIGFTVALFVAQLAYPGGTLLTDAKIGIFGGSLASGLLGYLLLRRMLPARSRGG